MKKELLLLCAPVMLLAGVGVWLWAFPTRTNPDLQGPLRAVLVFQKPSPLTKQEKFERYDTKVSIRFALHGTPVLPRGTTYNPATQQWITPTGQLIIVTLAARDYRVVTIKNGIPNIHPRNAFGILKGFTWHSGSNSGFNATISAQAFRAPRHSKNFITFNLIADGANPRGAKNLVVGVYALDLQTKKLEKWD